MAVKSFCYWGIGSVGDGSSTSVQFNFLTDPFVLGNAGAPSIPSQISPAFALTLSNLPTAITVISSSDGQTVTPTLGSLGNVTFSWPVAIPNGTAVTMYGLLEF
jgi:hypothetical protein